MATAPKLLIITDCLRLQPTGFNTLNHDAKLLHLRMALSVSVTFCHLLVRFGSFCHFLSLFSLVNNRLPLSPQRGGLRRSTMDDNYTQQITI